MTTAPAGTVTAALADAVWWVTRHALERWCERYDATATPPDAAAVLARVSREAIDTGSETHNGRAIYLHPEWPHARFVVAPADVALLRSVFSTLCSRNGVVAA